MPSTPRRLAIVIRASLRYEKSAIHDKHVQFANTLRARMIPKWWPFNAPRPQRRNAADTPEHVPAIEAVENSATIEDLFLDFDGQYPSGPDGPEDTALAHLSWRKTPSSKIRKTSSVNTTEVEANHPNFTEPPPKTPAIASIHTVITERPRSRSVPRIAVISRGEWETNYRFVRTLTPGNQGQIDLFRVMPANTLTIVKKIKVQQQLPMEVVIMVNHLQTHANIVEKLELFYDPVPQTCNIIMEYCSGGDLFDFASHWLFGRTEQIPEVFLLHFIASMGEALGYLHLGRRLVTAGNGVGMRGFIDDENHQAVLHRDIKLENIFLRWPPSNKYGLPDIVLGDFGGAVLESQCNSGFGTSGYFPPEVLRYAEAARFGYPMTTDQLKGAVMTKASDVYTFGACLCYMMLWGDFTPGMSIEPAFNRSNLRNWPLLLDLLTGCLADDPLSRPSTETLFNWAPMLTTHINFLHDRGVRMPQGSWAHSVPVAQDTSAKAMYVPSSVHCRDETDVSFAAGLPGRSFSTVYDDESIFETPNVWTAKAARFRRPSLRARAATIRKSVRMSSLFDVVERMANNLLNSAQIARVSRTFAGPGLIGRLSRQTQGVQLVSKFSDDSDGELD